MVYTLTILAVFYVAASFSGQLQKYLAPSVAGQVVIGLGAAAFLFYRARLLSWSLPWLLMSASMILTQCATLGSLVYALLSGDTATPWFLFAIYLAAYPLIFVALILLAREDRPPAPRNGLSVFGGWLDSAIVLVGGGMAVAFMGLLPALRANQGGTASLVLIACNAVMALLMLLAAARYALLQGRTLRPKVKILLTVGVVGALSAFILVVGQESSGGYVPGNAADGLYVIGLGALAWAGYLGSPRRIEDDATPHPIGMPMKNLLPLMAVMVGLGLLVYEVHARLRSALGGAVLCTVVLVLLVVARQVVAGIENGRLEAKRAALRTERRFRSLVTNSSDIILVTDTDAVVSYATPSAERLLGVDGATCVGVKLLELLAPEVRAAASAAVAECLERPHVEGVTELGVSASIGIVLSCGDDSPEDLMRHADTAMYEAKRAGGGRFDVFEPSMQAAIHRRLELQADLRRGAAEQEFVVHYQPVVEMATSRVVGLEALVRWKHPVSGLLMPVDFIDGAEQTGLVSALGRQVLREACTQAKTWSDRLPPGRSLSLAVNFSPRQLREPSVVSMVAGALEASSLEPKRLVMEVTEEALAEGEQPTGSKLWALKNLGVRLAIDDFGTGYSSLSRLSAFPFDYLKIDKQFVRHVADGRQESAVARTIMGLAHSLGMDAVAEGIEQKSQRDQLVDFGCRFGQGYLFSRPLNAEGMSAFLLARQAIRAPDRCRTSG